MTMKNEMRFSNNCGVSKSQLMKAINETFGSADIIKVQATTDEELFIIEYDGFCVTRWFAINVFDWINAESVEERIKQMEIIDMF